MESVETRFWKRVQKTPDCWLWTGWIDRRYNCGYGYMNVYGQRTLVHRYSYTLHVGPIPEGLSIDHLCRNRACVNPDHLEPVTRGENVLRGENAAAWHKVKDRCPRGHFYSPQNTYVWHNQRHCRKCRVISVAACRARKLNSTRAPAS